MLGLNASKEPTAEAKDYQSCLGHLLKAAGHTSTLQGNLAAQLIDASIQSYLKDAIRNVEIKIFRADLRLTTGQVVTHYFTNRLEIGHTFSKGCGSVYEKLASLRNVVNATSRQRCESAVAEQPFIDGIAQLQAELAGGSQPRGGQRGAGGGLHPSLEECHLA